jgi:hypothetical protein
MAKIHHEVAGAGCDFLHEVNGTIGKNHALVALDDLLVKNKLTLFFGHLGVTWKEHQVKIGGNRYILDRGWHMWTYPQK